MRAQAFRQAVDKREKERGDRSAWRRSEEIYRRLAPVLGVEPAEISRIHREYVDDDYEEVLKESLDCPEYSVYPRLLVRNTLMKWLIGSESVLEAEIWKYLVRSAREHSSPKILFQTKPKDVWVLMLDDLSHTATLRPTIVIPTAQDGRNAVILSIETFIKERENG